MPEKKASFIVITGSIMSGLGKGIVSSSIAKLFQSRGYEVAPIKFDGYLNVDCGTMNPFRHGEVFVLDDGREVDMDFGTYERFLNQPMGGMSSITGGSLFQTIIEKERKGEYLGRDVQFVPHLTDEIKRRFRKVAEVSGADVVLVEIGGTVGDLENGYVLEAVRQLSFEEKNVAFVQLTYVPSLSPGEQKTKPTQHATRLLQSLGIQPDMIIARGHEKLSAEAKEKIGQYCNVRQEAVIDDPHLQTVYELPLILEKQNVYQLLARKLGLKDEREGDLKNWRAMVGRIVKPRDAPVKVAIVGKYTAVKDAYVSVKEALVHAAAANNCGMDITWVEGSDLEKDGDISAKLKGFHGIVVPGGFGSRGIEGKISAIKYARENGIPFLGLCLGLQLMVVEYARNVCGMKGANSTEFDRKTPYPVIDLLPEQQQISKMGGTMRLGAYDAKLRPGTAAHKAYGKDVVSERHRHRYEVNPQFVQQLEEKGLVVSGRHESGVVEIAEWKESFGVATQPHIELTSRVEAPAPVFVEFVKAAKKRMDGS